MFFAFAKRSQKRLAFAEYSFLPIHVWRWFSVAKMWLSLLMCPFLCLLKALTKKETCMMNMKIKVAQTKQASRTLKWKERALKKIPFYYAVRFQTIASCHTSMITSFVCSLVMVWVCECVVLNAFTSYIICIHCSSIE